MVPGSRLKGLDRDTQGEEKVNMFQNERLKNIIKKYFKKDTWQQNASSQPFTSLYL
jgi:hypothetical protein